jgi:DNA repair exonuclease SbcCD ATPase subunit
MSTKQEAADGIRRFLRSLRTLEETLDQTGNLDQAAEEAQAGLDKLKAEEAAFLTEREQKETLIFAKLAARVESLKRDEEALLQTKEQLTAARETLSGLEKEIADRRAELKEIESRLAELRKMIVKS